MSSFTQVDTAVQRALLAAGGVMPYSLKDPRGTPPSNALQVKVDDDPVLGKRDPPIDVFWIAAIHDVFDEIPPGDIYNAAPDDPASGGFTSAINDDDKIDQMLVVMHLKSPKTTMLDRIKVGYSRDETTFAGVGDDPVDRIIKDARKELRSLIDAIAADIDDQVLPPLKTGATALRSPPPPGIPPPSVVMPIKTKQYFTRNGVYTEGVASELSYVIMEWLVEYITPAADPRLAGTPFVVVPA